VLSLLGAFGLNQNVINSNADYIATNTVEDYIKNNQSLTGDNQTNVAKANADAAEATDKVITDSKNATIDKTTENTKKNAAAANKAQNTESRPQAANTAGENTDSKVQETNYANNNATTENQAENQAQLQVTPVASIDASKCRVVNGQVYYGNVNISNCNSISDVVKVLNSCGYNITSNNIKDAGTLEDILAYANKPNNTTGNATKAPAATSAPSKTTTSQSPTTSNNTTTTTNTGVSNYASEVLRLVNVERSKAGLPALTTNQTLTSAANKRAQEIKQTFSHTRPNGSSCFTVLGEFGISYRTAGENIAYGQKTPQEVVNGWMNSPGHRANILSSNFGKVGIGVYQSNGVYYWTQLFTN